MWGLQGESVVRGANDDGGGEKRSAVTTSDG